MQPPGPRRPRALQTLDWLRRPTAVMERCHERYGDVFQLDMIARAVSGAGATPEEGSWVFLADPEHVKQLFAADPARVLTGETNRFLEALVGPRSILVLDEPEHMVQRRLMLPSLHGDRVHGYAELMFEAARAEVARWPRDEPFALWPRMQAITLEVISRAVFGIPEGGQLDRFQDLLRTMLNRMTSRRWLFGQAVRASAAGRRRAGPQLSRSLGSLVGPVDAFLYDEIRRRRAAPDLESREDILSTLVRTRYEDGSPMSDRELRDELITLLIAGHESTATALAWAFERLLRHPDRLERLRAEAATSEEAYADAVVKETLRLRTVLPIVLRKLSEPMEIAGYRLPAGTWMAPCNYLIHRRADVYPDPLRFRPERFLEAPAGTYTWMPFGGGVRRCLGASFAQLEMRQVLRAVVTHADLRPAEPGSERVASRFITLAPSRGARAVMEGSPKPAGAAAAPGVEVAA